MHVLLLINALYKGKKQGKATKVIRAFEKNNIMEIQTKER